MSVERVKDRKDEDINEGDHVWTRYRGGVREGDVSFPPNPLQTTLTLLSDLTNMFQSRLKVQKIIMDDYGMFE